MPFSWAGGGQTGLGLVSLGLALPTQAGKYYMLVLTIDVSPAGPAPLELSALPTYTRSRGPAVPC